MAVKYTEKFEKEFQKFLTPDNLFYLNTKGVNNSKDKTVNIPQYLTKIESATDPTSNSALNVVEWVEGSDVVIAKPFKTKAYQIPDIEEFFTSQDMKKDCMSSMVDFMSTSVGNYAAYKMATTNSATTIYTTGTATRATDVVGSSATVKKVVKADLLAVRTLMKKSNLAGKVYCLATPDQIGDLLDIAEFSDGDKLQMQSKLISGEFVDILGIRFFERSPSLGANVAYTTGGTKMDIYGAVGAADAVTTTTVGSMVFWKDSALYHNSCFANIYADNKSAIYQSDILSMQTAFGIGPVRTDQAGLVVLVEKAV